MTSVYLFELLTGFLVPYLPAYDFLALKNMPPIGGVVLYAGCMSSKPSLSPSEVTYLVVRRSRAQLLAWEQPDSSAEQLTIGEAADRRQTF